MPADTPARPPAPAAPAARGGSLAGAVRAVSGVTLLSRVGGLLRDVLLVLIFRDTALGSAFAAGFAIPNTFRRLFGEGALSASFVPEYTRTHATDPDRAGAFASLTVAGLLAAAGALTALIELALLGTLLLAPMTPDRALSIQLIMLMLPFMPLVCAAAILGGMLQVHGRFGPSAAGPLVLNAFIISVGIWSLATGQAGGRAAAVALGTATVLSGLTQCLWFAWLLRPYARWTRNFAPARESARRMLRRFLPALLGMGTLQVSTLLDTAIAMWPIWVGTTVLGRPVPLDGASNIILTAAQRLYQFPLGVFGIAVATAVFPMLSRHADEPAAFADTLRRGLRLSLFIGLPASVGLVLVRHDLVWAVFAVGDRGFAPPALDRAAAVVLGFAPAVWAYSLNHVLTRAFFAQGDTTTPMRIGIGVLGLNVVLNLTLIWPLREAGLAWSTSVCAMMQCAILAAVLRRRSGVAPVDLPTARAFGGIAAAAAIMAAAVLALQHLLPAPDGWAGHAAALGAASAVGCVSYAAAAGILKLPELRWLLRR